MYPGSKQKKGLLYRSFSGRGRPLFFNIGPERSTLEKSYSSLTGFSNRAPSGPIVLLTGKPMGSPGPLSDNVRKIKMSGLPGKSHI